MCRASLLISTNAVFRKIGTLHFFNLGTASCFFFCWHFQLQKKIQVVRIINPHHPLPFFQPYSVDSLSPSTKIHSSSPFSPFNFHRHSSMVRPSPSPSTKRHRTKRTLKKSRIKIIFFFLLLIFIIMASNNDSPPRFLLPPHIIPAHVLPTHRLWPLPQPTQGWWVFLTYHCTNFSFLSLSHVSYPKETDQTYSRPYGPPPAQENGRQYQNFKREIYPFPCDEVKSPPLALVLV